MTKAKRNTRKRDRAQGVARSERERVRTGKTGGSELHRGALPPSEAAQCGPPTPRRGVWKPVRSYVATAFYKIFGELAGLSETRPALGLNILVRALTAMGAKAPRVTASVTIGKPRAELLGALRG